MGLEEAAIEEEGSGRLAVEEGDRLGGDVGGLSGGGVQDLLVADLFGLGRDVLQAGEDRTVAGVAQGVNDVAAVVGHSEAAVRESEHSVLVGALSGEEGGAAGRAGGRGAEGAAEDDSVGGEAAQVRRGDGIPVGGEIAAGIVRVQVEDVERLGGGQLRGGDERRGCQVGEESPARVLMIGHRCVISG